MLIRCPALIIHGPEIFLLRTKNLYFYFLLDMSFWRTSARKIFAVEEDEYHTNRQRIQQQYNNNSQRRSCDETILAGIEEIKTRPGQSTVLTQSDNLAKAIKSTNLIEPLKLALKCMICQEVSASPVTVSLCCKQILGCSTCLSRVPGGRCPHCQNEDYSTIRLSAFENVLTELDQFF